MTETPVPPTTELTDAQKLRKAYGYATTALRENHREEFNALQQEYAHQLGLNWKPKPSDAEKAQAALDALIAEHPELLDHLAERVAAKKGSASE